MLRMAASMSYPVACLGRHLVRGLTDEIAPSELSWPTGSLQFMARPRVYTQVYLRFQCADAG